MKSNSPQEAKANKPKPILILFLKYKGRSNHLTKRSKSLMKTKKMKTTFKMKEATNAEEAIISILDVLEENPLWLNKCMDKFCRLIIEIGTTNQRQALLELTPERYVIDLFIELKTEYYNYKDFTQYNY